MRASGIHDDSRSRLIATPRGLGGFASKLILAAVLFAAGASDADDFRSACAPPPSPAPGQHSLRATPMTLNAVLWSARPGDVVALESGRYGQVRLSGRNDGFITVTAGPGQTAVLGSLKIKGSRWLVRGLTIDGSTGAAAPTPTKPAKWASHDWLVMIYGGDNIIVEKISVRSRGGAFPWQAETEGVDDPVPLYSGITTVNAGCVTISGNTITNVFNGVMIGGDQTGLNGKHYLVVENRIDNYAGDGIDHSTSDTLIARNVITNSHDICAYQCVHADGIQGWPFNLMPGIINTDVTIDGNVILQRTGPVLPQNGDSLQGVTIFDGSWKMFR